MLTNNTFEIGYFSFSANSFAVAEGSVLCMSICAEKSAPKLICKPLSAS